MEKAFMSIREAARVTGLGESYVRKGVKEKTIPFVMTGNKALVNVPLLMKQLNEDCQKRVREIEFYGF